MCRDSPREQSPGHPRSTAPGDHDDRGPCGAMPMVPIISRGLEMSADAALVVAEHQRALDEVRDDFHGEVRSVNWSAGRHAERHV